MFYLTQVMLISITFVIPKKVQGDSKSMEKIEMDSTLSKFLRESIEAFLIGKEKHENGIGYSEFDMDYCDLQTDINVCEVEQMITSDEAWRLREKYLGLQKM